MKKVTELYNLLSSYEGKFIKSRTCDCIEYVKEVAKDKYAMTDSPTIIMLLVYSSYFCGDLYENGGYDDPGSQVANCGVIFSEHRDAFDNIEDFNKEWKLCTKEEFSVRDVITCLKNLKNTFEKRV